MTKKILVQMEKM